jgi:excisionase family DNA binding protein
MYRAPDEVQQRYLSLADAAIYSGLSVRLLRRLITDRRLPASKMSPAQQGRVRIRVDDLDALMASLRVR